ncbi:unnamed protein product [Caenorhabditis bovis]|uniref:Uncharacterized protein n=1 Tax=Caenorhabditis bovis TaxID=2654633 RepID=A0A8S1ELJ7_9PELO|nr:unnamed protein product [Caenorhabditis bovis]
MNKSQVSLKSASTQSSIALMYIVVTAFIYMKFNLPLDPYIFENISIRIDSFEKLMACINVIGWYMCEVFVSYLIIYDMISLPAPTELPAISYSPTA